MAFIILHFLTMIYGSHSPDPCKVYGVVYIEESKTMADFLVYEEESEVFADVIIFEESNRLFADRAGIWHFTKQRDFADFTVYFTPRRKDADFSVAYTKTESFAGCNK